MARRIHLPGVTIDPSHQSSLDDDLASEGPAGPLAGGASGVLKEEGQVAAFPNQPVSSAKPPAVVHEVPPSKKYVVLEQARLLMGGYPVILAKGKVIDTAHYDYDMLIKSGVKLSELPA